MRSMKPLVCKRVLVNLTTGTAIEGVLWDEKGAILVLRDASLIDDSGQTPLDGEVVVERTRVEFIQAEI